MIYRRTFLAGTGAVLLTAPLAAEGQQAVGKVYRIAYVGSIPPAPQGQPTWDAFLHGLRERGWIDGQNIVIEQRYTGGGPNGSRN
jgi:putative ABC transport system substrate-binding protein